jgi:hypothetical protein
MNTDYKRMTDYLVDLGIDKVGHTSKSYLAHLVSLYRMMKDQGCSEELCRAGMFHSIYGTQKFQGFKLPLEKRDEVRQLIGERAERLAYLNCAMYRPSFDEVVTQADEPYRFKDRITGEAVSLSRQDFEDLMRVHLYDWLEQVPRVKDWGFRREAYRNMALRLGSPALECYDKVFAAEQQPSGVA